MNQKIVNIGNNKAIGYKCKKMMFNPKSQKTFTLITYILSIIGHLNVSPNTSSSRTVNEWLENYSIEQTPSKQLMLGREEEVDHHDDYEFLMIKRLNKFIALKYNHSCLFFTQLLLKYIDFI